MGNKSLLNSKNFFIILITLCIFFCMLSLYFSFSSNYKINNTKTTSAATWIDKRASSYGGGNGTLSSPYIISTASQLALLAYNVNNGNSYSGEFFQQTEDISLNGYDWVPIGDGSLGVFSGWYIGNGNKISNVTIASSYSLAGIFGFIKGALIQGVQSTGVSLSNETLASGGIVGVSYNSMIYQCFNIGSVGGWTHRAYYSGGIVGYSVGTTISACFNKGIIYSLYNSGGIVGLSEDSSIYHCYNTSIPWSTSNEVTSYGSGGIVGHSSKTEITDCFNVGTLMAYSASRRGGIVGYNDGSTITKCYYGGGCNVSYGIAYPSSNSGITKITDLDTQSYAKGEKWFTTSENWSTVWDFSYDESGYCWYIIGEDYPILIFPYNIIVYGNGEGTNATLALEEVYFSEEVEIGKVASKTGYTTDGWKITGNLNLDTAQYEDAYLVIFTGWYDLTNSMTTKSTFRRLATYGTVTFTAQWTPIEYEIYYNLDGGKAGSSAPTRGTYDQAITISNPTKQGYSFAGWTASGLDTSTAYYGSTKWSNASTKVTATSFKNLRSTSGTVTLTANWTAYQLTIQYHDGKGSDLSSINYDYENSKNVDLITYEKQGYKFNGWQIDKTGNLLNGTQNFSNHIQTSSAKIHLYPNLTPIKYQINFDKNSNQATGTMSNQKFTYDIEQSLNLNQYTRPGYKFLGWSISANSIEIAYSNGKKVKNLQDKQDGQITLYAVWQLEQYDLTIDANGGKYNGEGIYTKEDINSKSLLFLSTPTREGYVFDDWEVSSGNAEIQLSQYYLSSKSFNGTSDYQALGRTYMYEQNITINLFVYMDNWSDFVTSNRRFISCTESGGWNIEANGLNISAAFYQKSSGYNNVDTNVAWSSLSQGWHMFTLCFDKDYAIIYLDGNQIGKSTKWNNVIGYNSTNGVFLGSEATSSATTPNNQYFKGNLQNVVFYNNYLTGIIDLSNSTFSTLNNKENIYSCIMGTQNCTLKAKWKKTTISDMINSDSYEEGTIEISTTEDLLKLAVTLEKGDIGNGFTFVQTNNIDLKDVDWLPMGRLHNFSGTYDGQGYKITNLEVFSNQNTNKEYIQNFGGLFASINGGTVKNLIVESNEIQGNTAGIIVGSASVNANIENCIVSGIVNGTTIGSIAGAGGQIKNCLALNTVKGESNQTALLNFSTGAAINNCIYYNTNSNKGFYTGETIDYSKWAYINSYPIPLEIVWYPKTLTNDDLTILNIKKQSEFK